MGQLMRRHWIPALLSEQLAERDGAPVRVRLFGEDLVAFRDSDGEIGILGEYCPHRKASLFFGRNEECGLRCLYHGWKFDTKGNVLEMVSEPAESGFADKVKHKAYPTQEAGGFVWVYMGPREAMPAFEPPPWAPTPEAKVSIVKIVLPCNWAQIMEGQIDSAHSSSLHSSDMKPARVETAGANATHWTRPSTDKNPRIQVQLTNYGFRYAAVRKPIKNAQTHDYIRLTTYVAPFTALIPPNSSYNVASVIVPRDDVSSDFHFIAWTDGKGGIDQEAWRKFCVAQVGIDLDSNYRPMLRTRANNYLQDRKAMKLGDFTGLPGIPNQDIAMWESMGPIADRTSERLGASDIAIVQFRRLMIDAARKFAAGGGTIGHVEPHIPQAKLRSYQGIVLKDVDWRTLGASEEEISYLEGMEEDETDREMASAAE
ncbi:Rieske 2Fe-2S domain-containing protein [Antarcticirhabdus aurantiaca]|uniref:Rieske 2Fe-2S domain-containing protein n=1 Tax=Antarcticirhabdus aurantiaca TaxID=2606717 RepID=UPI001FF02F49|nr:Rieske 2Fe-2S domain-containing protein [Antarcticirhabdus aurantiaca]